MTGEVPAWLAWLDDLEYLYLEGNDFTGCIPAGLRDVQNHDLDRWSSLTAARTPRPMENDYV